MLENLSLFKQAMTAAFDLKMQADTNTLTVFAGPIVIKLLFSSSTMAKSYGQCLMHAPHIVSDLTINIITADDIDLKRLIPDPQEQGRAFDHGRYFCLWHFEQHPILYLLDRVQARGLIWFASGHVPAWELSRPACPLIHAYLSNTNWSTVHGAAVGIAGRMLLLAGPGRAGKTTAALSCALAGWDYAGDDYVLTDTSSGRIEPLYNSARLRADIAPWFQKLLDPAIPQTDGEDPRFELRLRDHLGPSQIRGGQLAALLLPRRKGASRPQFERARRGDALQAMLKNTMLGAPGPLRVTANKLSKLITHAPAFFVDTGSDPRVIPQALEEFMNYKLPDDFSQQAAQGDEDH